MALGKQAEGVLRRRGPFDLGFRSDLRDETSEIFFEHVFAIKAQYKNAGESGYRGPRTSRDGIGELNLGSIRCGRFLDAAASAAPLSSRGMFHSRYTTQAHVVSLDLAEEYLPQVPVLLRPCRRASSIHCASSSLAQDVAPSTTYEESVAMTRLLKRSSFQLHRRSAAIAARSSARLLVAGLSSPNGPNTSRRPDKMHGLLLFWYGFWSPRTTAQPARGSGCPLPRQAPSVYTRADLRSSRRTNRAATSLSITVRGNSWAEFDADGGGLNLEEAGSGASCDLQNACWLSWTL